MIRSLLCVFAGLILVLVGCQEIADPNFVSGAMTVDSFETTSADVDLAGKTRVAAARGRATFVVPPDVFGAEVGNVLIFDAKKLADGSVSGVYSYDQTFMGELFSFSGSVTCVNIYDDFRAKVGGIVETSNDVTIPPGVFIWWSVFDNDRVDGGLEDSSTIIGAGDEGANEAFCNSSAVPRFGPWEIGRGEFQIGN